MLTLPEFTIPRILKAKNKAYYTTTVNLTAKALFYYSESHKIRMLTKQSS